MHSRKKGKKIIKQSKVSSLQTFTYLFFRYTFDLSAIIIFSIQWNGNGQKWIIIWMSLSNIFSLKIKIHFKTFTRRVRLYNINMLYTFSVVCYCCYVMINDPLSRYSSISTIQSTHIIIWIRYYMHCISLPSVCFISFFYL